MRMAMVRDAAIALVIGILVCLNMSWNNPVQAVIAAVSVAGASLYLLIATNPAYRKKRAKP